MQKKLFCCLMAMLLSITVVGSSLAETKSATGKCKLENDGRSVTFSANMHSDKSEEIIRATAYLWELRNGTWYCISSTSKTKENSNFVSTSKAVTVDGGHYYRVTAVLYCKTGSSSTTLNVNTSNKWIG